MKLLIFVLLMISITARISGGDRITGQPFATRSEVFSVHGMAATSHPLATEAALEILRAGGSAVECCNRCQRMPGSDGADR